MQKLVKVNYVIGAWGGPRRDYPNNLFIKSHIDQLQKLKHNLSLVTIGYSPSPYELPEYTNFIKNIKQLNDGTPVEVFYTKNDCLSYGQWSRVFEKYRSDFDYYIFVEDDYLPVIDNFDQILQEIHKKGYLCSLVFDESGRYGVPVVEHGAISNGIVDINCLEAIHRKFGHLPCSYQFPFPNQVVFTRAAIEVDHPLSDYLGEYRSLFWDHYKIIVYGPKINALDIFVPIQYLEHPKKYPYVHIDATSWRETTYEEVSNFCKKIM